MSKISEKLKYLNNTKGLIREAIEEQGGIIEDTTTFREYAEAIKNIPGSVGDLESWEKIELPATFINPVYLGIDSDHVFITELLNYGEDGESYGLWMYNHSQKTFTRLYDKYGGYVNCTRSDDGHYVFYSNKDGLFDLLSYDINTNKVTVLKTDVYYKYDGSVVPYDEGIMFYGERVWDTNLKKTERREIFWDRKTNSVTIDSFSMDSNLNYNKTPQFGSHVFGDYILFGFDSTGCFVGHIHNGTIKRIDSTVLSTFNSYLSIVSCGEDKGFVSYGRSTTDATYLGLYVLDVGAQAVTKIYDEGYNWSHLQEFDSSFFLNSTGSLGVLKVDKNNHTCTRLTTAGSAWSGAGTEDEDEGMVKLNDRTILVVNTSTDRRVALYDIIDDKWLDLVQSSSYGRCIYRGDKMFLIMSTTTYRTVAYGISKISTVDNPVYAQTTKSASYADLYKTKWGFTFTVNGGGTTQVAGFAVDDDGGIKALFYDEQNYIRTVFKSRKYAYYYNNNTDDSHGLMIRIDPEDANNMVEVDFGKKQTYSISSVYQGPGPLVYIFGYGILGIYNEDDNSFKYYGDLGVHREGYEWDKTLPSWPTYGDDALRCIQAGPDHNYNWFTRGIIFCDEKNLLPQYSFKIEKVWMNYTYNKYYLEDIRSRRMMKIIPDTLNFSNYWKHGEGTGNWENEFYNFMVGINSKYLIICKDGEE